MPGGVDGEPGDAVVAAIGQIEELPRRRQVDLGAGVPCGEPGGQARDGLHGREGTGRTVEPIARDAAALLVGEVDEIQGRMKTVVARTGAFGGLDPCRRMAVRRPVCASNRNCMIILGPGFSFGGSSTLSLSRAMCGTKANWLEGLVAIAWRRSSWPANRERERRPRRLIQGGAPPRLRLDNSKTADTSPVRSGAKNVGACATGTVPSDVSPPVARSIRKLEIA
jgi:hypothetical protein